MKKNKKLWLGIAAMALGLYTISACSRKYAPLATVPAVDLEKYAGKWYEIAAFPQRYQKGCHCTSAEYRPHPKGYIEVLNACRKKSANGELETASGKAFPVAGSNNSKLKVQFFWPFKGDYWIIDLADDYSYAVVGSPDRESLWILARTPQLDETIYARLLSGITAKGFDVSQLRKTDQSCR
jgi:apolipoprotein D and lipocalin family protein